MNLLEVISQLNTTPFLFVGSGISRRYLNLPDWKGLLKHFAEIISPDEFVYDMYENRAKTLPNPQGIMPKVAELIQRDFDELWFKNKNIRTIEKEQLEKIHNGLSPFKAELSAYIKRQSIINTDYQEEIDKLSSISAKSITGIITTNYDTFLEDCFPGFSKYVGQSQLIFSSIQGIAEIYKIHGSVEDPHSIIINEEDYNSFEQKSQYLAAKLMTIFMEYPIIFMGYSIHDSNILSIITSIVNCLDGDQIETLGKRFIFIEYDAAIREEVVTPYTIMVGDKPLTMKKITLSSFLPIYDELEKQKSKIPVAILRQLKKELYEFSITNTPTAKLRVAYIDDNRIADEDLVLAIGKASELGLKGLSGITGDEWYRNIILEDLECTADELLEFAFPQLNPQNSGKLPLNKYLSNATKNFPKCIESAQKQNFDSIIPNSFKIHRNYGGGYTSVKGIWENEKNDIAKALRLIAYLTEDQINIDELECILIELFTENKNILQDVEGLERSDIRRAIRIYDYLKWGKGKGLSD